MAIQLKGTFQVTDWDETPYNENEDGSKQSHAKITQQYQGNIIGESELQYLMSYITKESAVFVGLETISCSINERAGSFVIKHDGKFESGIASSEFSIIPKSGKGELSTIAGTGSFKSMSNGQAGYTLEISL